MTSRLARRIRFCSAHRYINPNWSDEKNREIFGPCFNKHGHGHNYILEAIFEGNIDSETGMVIPLNQVDKVLNEVVTPLDHHFLNYDIPEFENTIPTTENIAKYCFDKIKTDFSQLVKVRLYESEDLWAEVSS